MTLLGSLQVTPSWKRSSKSFVWLFNVGRGLCIFFRTGINHGILYDIGSSEDFKPSDFLKKKIIPHLTKFENCNFAQVVLSHPHSDHIYDIECMHTPSIKSSSFYAHMHTCPYHQLQGAEKDEHVDFNRIKNQAGTEEKVDKYKELYIKTGRKPPLQTVHFPINDVSKDIEYGLFYVRPPVVAREFPKDNPKDNQEYGNGISILLYFKHKSHSIGFLILVWSAYSLATGRMEISQATHVNLAAFLWGYGFLSCFPQRQMALFILEFDK